MNSQQMNEKLPPKKTENPNLKRNLNSSTENKTRTQKRKGSTHTSDWAMSSKVAEADRYLKTQQQDNETQEETHTLTVQNSIIQQLQPPDFYFPTPNRLLYVRFNDWIRRFCLMFSWIFKKLLTSFFTSHTGEMTAFTS